MIFLTHLMTWWCFCWIYLSFSRNEFSIFWASAV